MQFLKFGGGRNFYLKDFRNAYHFRPDVAPPRQKFEGYINFVPNRALLGTFLEDNINLRTRLSSLVRTAQLPEVQIQTQVVNAFNQKRIVTSGREYAPVGITLFDTIQNEWLVMLMKYFTYSFADSTSKHEEGSGKFTSASDPDKFKTRDIAHDMLLENVKKYNSESKFGTDSSTKGYNPDAFGYTQRETPYFFERIDMIMYHGNTGVQYSLANPIITSINFGDIDYADSGFKDIQIQVAYEYFTVHDQLNFKLSEQDLSRFERMDNVNLPGRYAGDKKPIAITEPTTMRSVMGRERHPQIHTQFGDAGENVGKDNKFVTGDSNLGTSSNPTYTPAESREVDEGSILDKASDFLSDNPFGRILDKGLSAAVNGGDIKDALTGGLFNEITQGLQNPVEGDIFDGKAKRIDTGSDSNLGDSPDG
mgnify:CR=1 FL=1|tara:strand:- start:35213 stop:36478 length:1266 start_codon:yes stop_codon:yes gene_type:complete